MRSAFTRHYVHKDWGSEESVSGPGSTLERTTAIRQKLPPLFAQLGVRSVLDAGCGDFNWFRTLEVPLDLYVGTDVVRELIAENRQRYGSPARRFEMLDITRDRLPRVDLIFCRDCLVHLKNAQVLAALRNFRRSGSRYLLATTFTGRTANEDTPLGGWRPMNLQLSPFDLPSPVQVISEERTVEDGRYADKSLGLWDLAL
jgi:SAM-dependent methyltransferase